MIHCIYNARFEEIDGVSGQCVAGYVFSTPDGDDYIQTQPIHAIWQEEGELYVEDKAGCTYQIADFDDDEAARQVVFIQRLEVIHAGSAGPSARSSDFKKIPSIHRLLLSRFPAKASALHCHKLSQLKPA